MRRAAKAAAALLALALLLTACALPAAEPASDAAPTALEAYFFDAGKADAILLTTANSAVLIDTGEQGFGKTILARLEEMGVRQLDVLIVTHFDQDHVGGAAKVLNSIPVGTVLQSNQPKDSEEYEKYAAALSKAGIEPVTVRETYEFNLLSDDINATVYFEFSGTDPHFDAKTDATIRTLCASMMADPTLKVTITGHTDNVGSAASNMKYGMRRAEALKKLMVKLGAPAENIKCESHGMNDPIVPNDTDEHRQQNRRATVVLN